MQLLPHLWQRFPCNLGKSRKMLTFWHQSQLCEHKWETILTQGLVALEMFVVWLISF